MNQRKYGKHNNKTRKFVKAKFSFLILIKEKQNKKPEKTSKPYKKISEQTRIKIINFYKQCNYKREDFDNSQKFCIFECNKNGLNFLIKHYKMRIIIEIEKNDYSENTIKRIFPKAREDIKVIEKALGISEFVKDLPDDPEKDFIAHAYWYPFVEVSKDYKSSDFRNLEDEPITTFFYEIPDYRRKTEAKSWGKFMNIFSFNLPKTIIRVSRPSVITTSMSNFLRAELINIIYDTILYTQRAKKNGDEIEEEPFHEIKNHIGKSLIDIETSAANVKNIELLNYLSLIMSLGAIASIFAIISFMPSFNIDFNSIKDADCLKNSVGIFFIFIVLIIFCIAFFKRK